MIVLIIVSQGVPIQNAKVPTPPKQPEKDADVAKLERSLSDHLGAQTKIKEKAKGAGELIVEYSSLEELEGIIEKIGMDSR